MNSRMLFVILPVVLCVIAAACVAYVLLDLNGIQSNPANTVYLLTASILFLAAVFTFSTLGVRQLFHEQDREAALLRRSLGSVERRLSMSEGMTQIMNRISDLHETFSLSRDLNIVLNQAVASLKDIFSADALVLQLYSDEDSRFFLRIEDGGQDIPLGDDVKLGVIEEGKSRLINNLPNFTKYAGLANAGFSSMIISPFNRLEPGGKRKSTGLLAVLSKERRDFTGYELDLLTTFATHAALLIENARLLKRVEALAIHDGLTNLFNHRHFQEVLQKEVDKANQTGFPISLIILDIDDFKKFNDTFGHLEGDQALRTVADILMDNTRGKDVVARYGGEEFVVILPETSRSGALTVAQTIRQKVESCPFLLAEPSHPPVHMTVTEGVAVYPDDARDAKGLIASADGALYQGKRNGKNQVAVAAA